MMYAVLFPIVKLGIFDSPAPGNPAARVSTSEHAELARRIIEEGSVLLKNDDHLLPISTGKVKNIAIIGAPAGPRAIFGEEGPTVHVEKLRVPAEAIAQRAGNSLRVSYHDIGVGIRPLPLLNGDALTPEGGSGHGFAAAYYRTSDLSGSPAATRIDPAVNVNGLPAPELGPKSALSVLRRSHGRRAGVLPSRRLFPASMHFRWTAREARAFSSTATWSPGCKP